MKNLLRGLLCLCWLAGSVNTYAQRAASMDTLRIEGEVLKPLKLTAGDLAKLKPCQQRAKDKDGKSYVYTGVALADLLQLAGATLGKQLRGENLAKYLLVTAADGYEAVFSLPEIDPEFTSQTILLATQRDGKPLPDGEGSYRIIVPLEKKHARWVREVVSLKVVFAN